MKSLEIILFLFSALCVVGGGLITVGSRKPIRSAMGLLATIVGIAGCYLLLAAELLAAVQVIVYAGAVVILFIFVVMLLGSAATSPSDAGSAVPRYLGAGVFLAASAGALLLVLRVGAANDSGGFVAREAPPGFGTIERVGRELFTEAIVPFELSAVLLLVAVVGALAVARGRHTDPTQRGGEAPTGEPVSQELARRELGSGGATSS